MSVDPLAFDFNRSDHALRRDSVPAQALWYLLVGGLSFLADFALFSVLVTSGFPVVPALVLGFALGTIVNYVLSLALAFQGGRHSRWGEIARLAAVSLVGLALTAVLVWALMALGLSAVWAKIVATGPVLAWNYLGRRHLVFHQDMPQTSWSLADRAARSVRRPR